MFSANGTDLNYYGCGLLPYHVPQMGITTDFCLAVNFSVLPFEYIRGETPWAIRYRAPLEIYQNICEVLGCVTIRGDMPVNLGLYSCVAGERLNERGELNLHHHYTTQQLFGASAGYHTASLALSEFVRHLMREANYAVSNIGFLEDFLHPTADETSVVITDALEEAGCSTLAQIWKSDPVVRMTKPHRMNDHKQRAFAMSLTNPGRMYVHRFLTKLAGMYGRQAILSGTEADG